MNTKVDQAPQAVSAADVAKYVVAVALVAGAFFAFYWFKDRKSTRLNSSH